MPVSWFTPILNENKGLFDENGHFQGSPLNLASLVAQTVMNLPPAGSTLDWEDQLEMGNGNL